MYCTKCGKAIGEDAIYCQYCGVRQTGVAYVIEPKRKLQRSRRDKKIGGVCAGFAEYFDLDATVIRVVWLLCLLLAGTGLLAYIIAWIVIPLEPDYMEVREVHAS